MYDTIVWMLFRQKLSFVRVIQIVLQTARNGIFFTAFGTRLRNLSLKIPVIKDICQNLLLLKVDNVVDQFTFFLKSHGTSYICMFHLLPISLCSDSYTWPMKYFIYEHIQMFRDKKSISIHAKSFKVYTSVDMKEYE